MFYYTAHVKGQTSLFFWLVYLCINVNHPPPLPPKFLSSCILSDPPSIYMYIFIYIIVALPHCEPPKLLTSCPCHRTCHSLADPHFRCPTTCLVSGCACAGDMVLDERGHCIRPEECVCYDADLMGADGENAWKQVCIRIWRNWGVLYLWTSVYKRNYLCSYRYYFWMILSMSYCNEIFYRRLSEFYLQIKSIINLYNNSYNQRQLTTL